MRPVVGEPYTIPKGAPVHSMKTGRWRAAGRTFTVWPSFVDRYGDDRCVVTWPGSGGYWQRVHVLSNSSFVRDWPEDQT